VYAIINSAGTAEKGKISKPEREGKPMPQTNKSTNMYN
jgi:hypothetical protein